MTDRKLKPCIAIDWLQCTVKMPQRNFTELFTPFQQNVVKVNERDYKILLCINERLTELNEKYLIEDDEIQTRNFKKIYTVKDRKTGEDIAVIAAEPRSLMCMSEDTALIKITNKYLYQKNFSDFVRNLFADLRLSFMNITRLDIAYDFERFDTMECNDFIKRVRRETYLKTLKSKFKDMGETISVDKGKKTGGTDSMKFGLETSDVNYYLYNKTKELQQVKHKPYIHDHWKENGWEGETEVYRLEFSLKPDTKGIPVFVIDEDGELKIENVLHYKDLSMIDEIQKVFEFHFNKHFQFVRAERTDKGNWKKQSRCKAVTLFKTLTFESVKIPLSNKKDSGRSDKVFAKKLMQLNQELRGQDFDLAIAGNELFTMHIKLHDLTTWAEKKLGVVEYSERIMDLIGKSNNARLQMALMNDKKPDARVYKTAKEQCQELINLEMSLRAKNMQIAPDGKIASYDRDGKLIEFVEPVF